MSVHPNHRRTRLTTADLILSCLAILGCLYLLFLKKPMAVPMGPLREIDAVAQAAASRAGAGNLVVSGDSDPRAVSILHRRAVYALWPRRLFAALPDVVILHSEQISPATRPADPEWLKANHVTASVKFGVSDNRLIVDRVDPISP